MCILRKDYLYIDDNFYYFKKDMILRLVDILKL